MTERDEMELDRLFAEARGLRPEPGGDLMARLMADADRVAEEREVPAPAPVRGSWRDWFLALGGWPALGGLVASTLAGVWIGVAQPDGLAFLPAALSGERVDVAFGVDEDPLSLLEG